MHGKTGSELYDRADPVFSDLMSFLIQSLSELLRYSLRLSAALLVSALPSS